MKDALKDKIAKDTLWYTMSVYVAQFLGIFSGIATRKFLGPEDMGLWVLFQTFMTFGLFCEMGIFTAMYCKIPIFMGQKDEKKVSEALNVSFSFAFTGALIAAAFFVGRGLWTAHGDQRVLFGNWATAILLVLTLIYNFYISCSWALNRFKSLGITVMVNAVLTLGLVFLYVRPWGFYGSFASALTVTLVSVVSISRATGIKPSFQWKWPLIKELLWFGFPIFVGGMIFTFFLNLDRVIIAKYFDHAALGHYSIAMIVFLFSSTAPKMLSIVLFPKIQEEYAASGDLGKIMRMVVMPDRVIAFFSPLILGVLYFFIPVAVHQILPKYIPGILSAQILLLGGFFISLVYNSQSFLIAVDKRMHSIPFLLSAMAVLYMVSVLLIRRGFGIEGVAAGVSAGFFFYFISLTFYALRHQLSGRELGIYYSQIAGVLIYFLFFLWLIGQRVYSVNAWVDGGVKSALLAAASLPVFYFGDRQTHAVRYGFGMIMRRFGFYESERTIP